MNIMTTINTIAPLHSKDDCDPSSIMFNKMIVVDRSFSVPLECIYLFTCQLVVLWEEELQIVAGLVSQLYSIIQPTTKISL